MKIGVASLTSRGGGGGGRLWRSGDSRKVGAFLCSRLEARETAMEDACPRIIGWRGRPRKYATAADARQARNEVRRAKRRERGVRPRVLLTPAEKMQRKVEEKRRWRDSDPAIRAREAAAKRRKRAELRKQQCDDARRQLGEEAEARIKEEAKVRPPRKLCAAATNRFRKAFVENPLGSVCDVCDRLWYANDLTRVKAAWCELLRRHFPTRNVAEFNVCRTCVDSLRQGKIPNYSTTNGYVDPPKPPHLPHLNLVSERMVSLPWIRFMQIRRLHYTVINVPISVTETVAMLPNALSNDREIHVHFKRRVVYKPCSRVSAFAGV